MIHLHARQKITNIDVAKALKMCGGYMSHAAALLRVSVEAVRVRVEKSEHLQQIIRDERVQVVDLAESGLIENIRAGHPASIIFALKTQGKERGYQDKVYVDGRHELSGPEGGPIETKSKVDLSSIKTEDIAAILEILERNRESKSGG